jgi:hypothetical protein
MARSENGIPGVDRYINLDLSPSSDVAEDLLNRVAQEARRPTLSLSGDGVAGALSANLTPAMSAWLGKCIAPARQAAITAIESAAYRIRLPGNTQGVVAEIEDDRLKRVHNSGRSEKIARFYEKHQSAIDQMNTLQREYDALRAEEGNRDALTPSRAKDLGLIVLIAIPEGFINYSSFFLWTKLGVVALGMTLVVALAIGLASFLTGRFWKAYSYYMPPDDPELKRKGYRLIGIAGSLLSVSLTFVGVARYRTVLEQYIQAVILGLPPPNVYTQTASLLVGNFLIFMIGAAITYWIHDENPRFAEKALDLAKCRTAFENAKTKDLQAKLAGIEEAYRQNKNKMLKRARLMDSQSDYENVADAMGRVAAKDEEVLGLLQDYRCQLVDALEQRDPDFRFAAAGVDRQTGNVTPVIGLSEFSAMPLYLYRCAV